MKNPLNTNGKIIDAANVTAIKPIGEDRLSGIDTHRKFTAEIRTIDRNGAFVESASVAEVASALEQVGEKLTMLPSGEAIRADWITAIKPFVGNGQQTHFHSVVQFRQPDTGATLQEWFTAPVKDIPGGTAPVLSELLKRKTVAPMFPAKKAAAKAGEPTPPK